MQHFVNWHGHTSYWCTDHTTRNIYHIYMQVIVELMFLKFVRELKNVIHGSSLSAREFDATMHVQNVYNLFFPCILTLKYYYQYQIQHVFPDEFHNYPGVYDLINVSTSIHCFESMLCWSLRPMWVSCQMIAVYIPGR